jgi:hypothetical protein
VLPGFSEEAVHSFIEEFGPGVFRPEDVTLLADAFDDAWCRVRATKLHTSPKNTAPQAARYLPSTY